MKRTFLLLSVILLSFAGIAQTAKNPTLDANDIQDKTIVALLARIDSLITINNELLSQLEINTSLNLRDYNERYKLYPTDNIYTLLQLDTKTGQIEQVQWSLDSYNEGSITINSEDLSYGYGHADSFELYPTQNMYQLILIDKTDGRKWHVQWGMSDSARWIRRIISLTP